MQSTLQLYHITQHHFCDRVIQQFSTNLWSTVCVTWKVVILWMVQMDIVGLHAGRLWLQSHDTQALYMKCGGIWANDEELLKGHNGQINQATYLTSASSVRLVFVSSRWSAVFKWWVTRIILQSTIELACIWLSVLICTKCHQLSNKQVMSLNQLPYSLNVGPASQITSP
jgi:hypothetical protein